MKNAELVISQTVNFALWTLPPNKSRTKVPPLSPASKEYIIASYDKDVRTSFIMFQEYYHWHGAIYSIPFQKENHQDMFPQTSHHKFLWSSLSAASGQSFLPEANPPSSLLYHYTLHTPTGNYYPLSRASASQYQITAPPIISTPINPCQVSADATWGCAAGAFVSCVLYPLNYLMVTPSARFESITHLHFSASVL